MRSAIVAAFIGMALFIPRAAAAQSGPAAGGLREGAFSVGVGNLSHGDDSLGWGLTLGGGVTIPIWQRLAVRIDAHRTYGPDPKERSCEAVAMPCTGVGRYGVRDLTIWSGNGVYYFGSNRVRPYIIGGLDVLHFTFLSDVTTSRAGRVTITELERHHTTMGITLGAGVRVPVGARLSVTPEIKVYDGTMLAGANLAQVRTAVAVGFRW